MDSSSVNLNIKKKTKHFFNYVSRFRPGRNVKEVERNEFIVLLKWNFHGKWRTQGAKTLTDGVTGIRAGVKVDFLNVYCKKKLTYNQPRLS